MRALNGPGAHASKVRSEASAEISSLIEGGNDQFGSVYPRPRLSAHGESGRLAVAELHVFTEDYWWE